ncbi:chemotaxis response regulator protein-glutamate methylesterase [Yersinia mollaretii]|uniref:Protein-glutamate methylesterase/protein-glutamine glutaminase n=2 Tax=Yersinia mollaretii TaxID=33060 RepID=A0AA36PL57_YERMO|nr:chemotaxis response regulator protein-glutamate methylesterase [Yersinia mollaretii]CNK62427.1 chemotaxis-specific methylesterase [Yersinia enterocolitica]MDA5528393.1 chemotaxis response regulator protein-glutamate methylesterase [Yersinia mollaretii]MDA5535589.1 chemotaxis response regulator protein-glutamate methylesterase [Yersinia mollaretii]MDR7874360.1 chemotaxis response regulator protein-glutamate methylesterase [Yersinia mollaretii]NIL03530.1 chemotaxis response regulator protein-
MKKIRVLCVDDSALIRSIMTDIVNHQPDMEMVAAAPDPIIARDLIKQYDPDVLTLDVEMPRMDGLDFLERLMRLRPMPVIMVSSLTGKGSEITLSALELGAIDFVTKPQMGLKDGMMQYAEIIAEKIRMASKVQVKRGGRLNPALKTLSIPLVGSEKIIAIGSSTGGTEALRQVLIPMPLTCPGIVIAQHMPPGFTRSFAERLNNLCQISVKEAEDGDRVLPGHAYIAPGDNHMELVRSGANYHLKLNQSPPVNRHRPAVDVLFKSVAKSAGKNAVGVILTGMGSDGAIGLLEMRKSGAHTLAQSEKSCVVFGMPREAIALGAACEVVDLGDASQRILNSVVGQARRI